MLILVQGLVSVLLGSLIGGTFIFIGVVSQFILCSVIGVLIITILFCLGLSLIIKGKDRIKHRNEVILNGKFFTGMVSDHIYSCEELVPNVRLIDLIVVYEENEIQKEVTVSSESISLNKYRIGSLVRIAVLGNDAELVKRV